MNRTPDLPKARALAKNAKDTYDSISQSASKSARFLLNNYYSCIIEYIQSILALNGITIHGKDHHKEAIEHLRVLGILSEFEAAMLDNLRRIRNDILYYGTKSEQDIEDFYALNLENIQKLIAKLRAQSPSF